VKCWRKHNKIITVVVMEEAATNNNNQDSDAARRRRFAAPEDEATWIMLQDRQEYRPYITALMNFFHDDPDPCYTKDTVFTRAQLLELKPNVVKRWMAKKAYGKEEYDPKRDVPKGARASSLEMMKKAVSYFMPNKTVPWVNGAGNPTRHSSVHKVIADVKKAEARHQGRSSKSTRPLREGDAGAGSGEDSGEGAGPGEGAGEAGPGEGAGEGAGGGGGAVAAATGNSTSHDLLQSIHTSIQQLQQQLNEVAARSDANFSDLRAYMRQRDRILNDNIRAYFGGTIEGGLLRSQQVNTSRRLLPLATEGGENAGVGPAEATLSGNPKSLNELWQEYQHGIDGHKPARNFTARERNSSRQMKQKFYRRKQVWDTISRLVANGNTVQFAIERIKQVYGQSVSVSGIINGIIRDKRIHGGPHPNLV